MPGRPVTVVELLELKVLADLAEVPPAGRVQLCAVGEEIRVVGASGNPVPVGARNYSARSMRSYIESEFTDFGNMAEGVTAIVAGAGAANGSAAAVDKTDHPGVWELLTGTTATGRGFIIGSATRGYQVGGGGLTRVGSIVKTGTTLSTALEEYTARVGFFSIDLPNTILE
ncbi:hypothetical protein LCGC14_2526640, partial [marine sediment metagenome]